MLHFFHSSKVLRKKGVEVFGCEERVARVEKRR
jgi:hypothetical protein